MTSAADALLGKAMTYVATNGMSDLSLREIAAGTGTSHRMLLYHFGSREGLVAAVVAAMECQQRDLLETLARDAVSPRQLVESQWAQLTEPAVRPFVALFFEVLALAVHGRPGTEEFLGGLTAPWLELSAQLADRFEMEVDAADLRLGVAVVRGLLIEVLASGDLEGPTASLHRFLDLWSPEP